MTTRFARLLLVAVSLTFALAAPSLATLDGWTCTTFSSSSVQYLGPYNYGCIGYSGTCRECGAYNSGGYGYFICYDTGPGASAVYCVDYQGAMDFPF